MDLSDALHRIGAIHEQLAKTEVYRGYHPAAVALSGLLGLAAAGVQPWLVAADDPASFLRYWLAVGAVCGMTAAGATVLRYYTAEDEFSRRRTRTVVGQFLPCLVAGGILTLALSRSGAAEFGVPLLPGLWAVLFGLGIVASVPYLPRATVWVAAWFFAAGFAVLLAPDGAAGLSGWTVGVPFGVGQVAMAAVFHAARHQGKEVQP